MRRQIASPIHKIAVRTSCPHEAGADSNQSKTSQRITGHLKEDSHSSNTEELSQVESEQDDVNNTEVASVAEQCDSLLTKHQSTGTLLYWLSMEVKRIGKEIDEVKRDTASVEGDEKLKKLTNELAWIFAKESEVVKRSNDELDAVEENEEENVVKTSSLRTENDVSTPLLFPQYGKEYDTENSLSIRLA